MADQPSENTAPTDAAGNASTNAEKAVDNRSELQKNISDIVNQGSPEVNEGSEDQNPNANASELSGADNDEVILVDGSRVKDPFEKAIADTQQATSQTKQELEALKTPEDKLKDEQREFHAMREELAAAKKQLEAINSAKDLENDDVTKDLEAILAKEQVLEPDETDDYYGYLDAVSKNEQLDAEKAEARAKLAEIKYAVAQGKLDAYDKVTNDQQLSDASTKFSTGEDALKTRLGPNAYSQVLHDYEDYLTDIESTDKGAAERFNAELLKNPNQAAENIYKVVQVFNDRRSLNSASSQQAARIDKKNAEAIQVPSVLPSAIDQSDNASVPDLDRALKWASKPY